MLLDNGCDLSDIDNNGCSILIKEENYTCRVKRSTGCKYTPNDVVNFILNIG